MPEVAEAYQIYDDAGAACNPDPVIRNMIRCHSIHWEPDFLSEPAALGRAVLLRTEVLSSSGITCWHPWTMTSTTSMKSSLKKCTFGTRSTCVSFQPWIEIIEDYFPPRFEALAQDPRPPDDEWKSPQEDEVTVLMARQPQRLPSSPGSFASLENTVSSPSSPSTFSDDMTWVSVQVYDMRSNYARGRVHAPRDEHRFSQVRRLLGYGHHEVANIFPVDPLPSDLLHANIYPELLLLHDDLVFGDNRVAVLIDIELYGHGPGSMIEVDRYTRLLPSPLSRSLLLRLVGVDRYCETARQRCLVWHRGQLVPLQHRGLLQLHHGDFLRLALPPFSAPEIDTFFAVRACQHGLSPLETIQRYRENPNPNDLTTDIEQDLDRTDQFALFQLTFKSSITATLQPQSCRLEDQNDTGNNVSYNIQITDQLRPDITPLERDPAWLLQLRQAFEDHAAVAHEDEGPIAFITTWYLAGSYLQKTEESRTLKIDQHAHLWLHDIHELWRDKMDVRFPFDIILVHPEPPRPDTVWTIGHLIIYQNIEPPFLPGLITIKFLSNRRTGINYVATVLPRPTFASTVLDLCNLHRFCDIRECDLQFGDQHYSVSDIEEEIILWPGFGVIFNIYPPTTDLHIGEQHQVDPPWMITTNDVNTEELEAIPNLEDQSPFVQDLFRIWDIQALPGPANFERLLQVTTWCLRAPDLSLNDEIRTITLGDDFHLWETILRRRWLDLLDPNALVEFAIVQNPPPNEHSQVRLHIIVYQFVAPHQCVNIASIYDNGTPLLPRHDTAVVLPCLLQRHHLLRALEREQDCPPYNPASTCTTWHASREISDAYPSRIQHGDVLTLIIHRAYMYGWDDEHDEDAQSSAAVTSHTSLLQLHAHIKHPTQRTSLCGPGDPGRQTTGQVAHTQWPKGTPLQLRSSCLSQPPL